jgi:fimbrial isopeptide formation D2 family protein
VGYYEFSKTSDPTPGTTVGIGDVVTYTVRIHQRGDGAVEHARISDDLSAVLDDATWDDDLQVRTGGTATRTGATLVWTGPLAVGQVVTLTYSVTVTGAGDDSLDNVVTTCAAGTADCTPGTCVPAPDQNPDCATSHPIGDFTVQKTSDPRPGSTVAAGDMIDYTITVQQVGKAAVDASFQDDLAGVLDDARWNGDAVASAGRLARHGKVLAWSGHLARGGKVTVTYSVTVIAGGDRLVKNVVTTTGRCLRAQGEDHACVTVHHKDGPDPVAASGGLPNTGGPRLMLLGGGLGLLLLGLATLMVARYRRRTALDG